MTSTRGTHHQVGDEVELLSYGTRCLVVQLIDKDTMVLQKINHPAEHIRIARAKVCGVAKGWEQK